MNRVSPQRGAAGRCVRVPRLRGTVWYELSVSDAWLVSRDRRPQRGAGAAAIE